MARPLAYRLLSTKYAESHEWVKVSNQHHDDDDDDDRQK